MAFLIFHKRLILLDMRRFIQLGDWRGIDGWH
jgi:hypothetical protein